MRDADARSRLSERLWRSAQDVRRAIFQVEDVAVLMVHLDNVRRTPAASQSVRTGLVLSEISTASVITLLNIRPEAESLNRSYMEASYSGYIAHCGATAIGYLWLFNGRQHQCVDRYGIRLDEEDVYMFSYYIAPEFRGRQRGLHFLREVMLLLAEKGYRRAYGFVLRDNVAASWIYAVLGWETVARRRNRHILRGLMIAPDGIFVHRRLREVLRPGRRGGPSDFLPVLRWQAAQ